MSTDRHPTAAILLLALGAWALGPLDPAVAQEPAGEVAQEPDADEPEDELEPESDGRVLDEPVRPADPGDPPRPLDDDGTAPASEPFGEEATTPEEPTLGSYFLTSVAVGGADDRVSGSETVTIPGTRPPGRPTAPVGPPTTITRDVEFEESGWLARPSFLFVHRPSARSSLVMAYEPEFEQMDRGNEPDRVSHSAGLNVEHHASRRTEMHAGVSYLDSLDPSRHLGGDSFVLIPGRFEQQRAYGGLSHRVTRATKLSVYGEYSTAESDLATEELPIDLTDLSGTLALEQGIGRKSHLTFSYSYTDTEFDSLVADTGTGTGSGAADDPLASENLSGPVESLRAGFGHRPTARFSFFLGGGALREEDELTGEQETTWVGTGEVAREGETLTLRLRLDRSLFAFGSSEIALIDGVADPAFGGTAVRDTIADTLSFHLEMFPPGRVRFEQSVWLSRRSLLEGDDVESFVTASLVELILTPGNAARLGLFGRFDYFDRGSSDLLGDELSRQRFTIGLRVGLTGPQTKVAHRLAVDELRRVLPSGGRL